MFFFLSASTFVLQLLSRSFVFFFFLYLLPCFLKSSPTVPPQLRQNFSTLVRKNPRLTAQSNEQTNPAAPRARTRSLSVSACQITDQCSPPHHYNMPYAAHKNIVKIYFRMPVRAGHSRSIHPSIHPSSHSVIPSSALLPCRASTFSSANSSVFSALQKVFFITFAPIQRTDTPHSPQLPQPPLAFAASLAPRADAAQ